MHVAFRTRQRQGEALAVLHTPEWTPFLSEGQAFAAGRRVTALAVQVFFFPDRSNDSSNDLLIFFETPDAAPDWTHFFASGSTGASLFTPREQDRIRAAGRGDFLGDRLPEQWRAVLRDEYRSVASLHPLRVLVSAAHLDSRSLHGLVAHAIREEYPEVLLSYTVVWDRVYSPATLSALIRYHAMVDYARKQSPTRARLTAALAYADRFWMSSVLPGLAETEETRLIHPPVSSERRERIESLEYDGWLTGQGGAR